MTNTPHEKQQDTHATVAQATPRRKRPWPLEIVLALNYLSCFIGIVESVGFIIDGVQNGSTNRIVFGTLLVVCMLGFLSINFALSTGANWARITLLVLLVPALLGELVSVVLAPNTETVGRAVISVMFLWLLSLRSTRQFCTSKAVRST